MALIHSLPWWVTCHHLGEQPVPSLTHLLTTRPPPLVSNLPTRLLAYSPLTRLLWRITRQLALVSGSRPFTAFVVTRLNLGEYTIPSPTHPLTTCPPALANNSPTRFGEQLANSLWRVALVHSLPWWVTRHHLGEQPVPSPTHLLTTCPQLLTF